MKDQLLKLNHKIQGMTCAGCEDKIIRILSRIQGVSDIKVSFSNNSLTFRCDSDLVHFNKIEEALSKAGYSIVSNDEGTPKKVFTINQFVGVGIILLALYLIVKNTIGFNVIPEITPGMGYGVLFLVGLLTSLHCVAMCGGINISQCVSQAKPADQTLGKLRASALYNSGRVISYTIIGGIVGALGSAVSFSGPARGLVAILSGVFMVIMGISLMGIFPSVNKLVPSMPLFLRRKTQTAGLGKGPFIIGLLNGLMPCGPLQAMQIYALGTGSALAGAASMFFFSLGTVPLMFGLGAVSSLLGSKFTARMLKASAVFVLILGLIMMNRGLALSGISFASLSAGKPETIQEATVENGVQMIQSQLTADSYPEITVTKGIPVKWILTAEAKDLNGCNNVLIIPSLNYEKKLQPGDNIIEFTPAESGTIPYSCWMGMIKSKIIVN